MLLTETAVRRGKALADRKPLIPSAMATNAKLEDLLTRRSRFLAFVARRVDDRALAEDILQAAYMRALERSTTLRDDESAVAWFFAVLRNAIIDHFRRRSTESSALERWTQELAHGAATSIQTHDLVCHCIAYVLPSLRPAYAEILREVDLAEEPLSTYATRHQLTPGNAAVRAHRARAALKRELARTCGACAQHKCLNCDCKRA
ncbi:RNA polymerase sigma-70 factor, ECF subfamily [Bryocella elongata]|uniref:RNA polymerase sigma factor n=1 Tax=Bryocella elongata TaxID=863522 RepID=A0A1H6A4V3_9BACT|nr:sigma-70 family RNA polymerase sigma factor [Bryocella elongata]SEG43461.1 RNA polymerase sigma-70 factor, ECF subfamily [Bryocella elongata]